MPGEKKQRYIGGQVGLGASVIQGDYNNIITIQPKTADDVIEILRFAQKQQGVVQGPGLPRRLVPEVFVNRWEQYKEVERFFDDDTVSILYVFGLPGIGKSALIRAALELKRAEVPVLWVNCEKLDVERLLRQVNGTFKLELDLLLNNADTPAQAKIEAVFGSVEQNSILVLRGFETLLDERYRYLNDEMGAVVEALTTGEHKVKTVVSTGQLPRGVGRRIPSVQVISLVGLSPEQAEERFLELSGLSPEDIRDTALAEALKKLEGHPQFIELLASAVAVLPPDEVSEGLLSATNIGDYIAERVLGTVPEQEMLVLRATCVFRDAFPFDALKSVYSSVATDGQELAPSVQSLVSRALLQVVSPSPVPNYYLHRIVRDAVAGDPDFEAAVHEAAANWSLREPIEPSDPTTWDDGLYYLRRCAEVGRGQKHFDLFLGFLTENADQLEYAGWGRRLVDEYKALDILAENESDRLIVRFALANQLWTLKETDEATQLFQEVSEGLSEINLHQEEEVTPTTTVGLVKANLAQGLVAQGKFEEARQIADEIEPIAEAADEVQLKTRYWQLRFEIARKSRAYQETLDLAKKYFESAQEWLAESPLPQTKNAVAEAHFALGIAYLHNQEWEEMFGHFSAQLRIKVEIGRLSGVAAGLYNLGTIFCAIDLKLAGALILTSDQIKSEIGIRESDRYEDADAAVQEFLESGKIDPAREFLGNISEQILPYFERALER
ncbi:MAG: hypothetical protein V3U79_07600 [Dehalococcoidia bacterium]